MEPTPRQTPESKQGHPHMQEQTPAPPEGTQAHSLPNPQNPHGHTHGHQQTQAVKRMVEDGRDCSEVLVQIAAVRSAINNIGKIILEDHISHCIVHAVEHGDSKALEDLKDAIETFIK